MDMLTLQNNRTVPNLSSGKNRVYSPLLGNPRKPRVYRQQQGIWILAWGTNVAACSSAQQAWRMIRELKLGGN